MSRVGRKPISIPKGVKVSIDDGAFLADGPKGQVRVAMLAEIPVAINDGTIEVSRTGEDGPARAKHGLIRALLANAVNGAANGFTKELDIVGVGYKAELKGDKLQLALGYSHPILFPIPKGIQIAYDAKANRLTITGADRQMVGQVAAELRSKRKPDPYKGKGVKYRDEILRRKVGKAGAK